VLAALGAHWREAVPILRILAPAALVETLGSATSWVYSAVGRTDRQARWTAFASVLRLLAVSVGVAWGVFGVAAATSLSTFGLRYWGIRYCFRESPLEMRDLGGALWRPACAALVAGVFLIAAGGWGPAPASPALAVVGAFALFALAYVGAWIALPGGKQALREVTALARDLRPARRPEPALQPDPNDPAPLGQSVL
jgi:O-antigen/teichoic acid export membrane protein